MPGGAPRGGTVRGARVHPLLNPRPPSAAVPRAPTPHDALTRDLHAERAGALARTAERLEEALREYAEADAASAAAPSPISRERRRLALARAGERLWFLVIQREAVGLHRHDEALDILGVPRAVRAAMGPARR